MKICPRCGDEKPTSAYGSRKSSSGNICLRSWCKACEVTDQSVRAKANPTKKAAENKQYRERHLDRMRAKDRAYNRLHRDPVKKAEAVQRRRAKKRGAAAIPYSRRAIYERDEGLCGICHQHIDWNLSGKDPEGFSIDHLTPASLGGTDTIDNVRSAHMRCNARRGAANGVIVVKRRRKVLV